MKLISAGRTDPAKALGTNQDALRISRAQRLFIVARGAQPPWHNPDLWSAQFTIEAISEHFRATSEDPEVTSPFNFDEDRQDEESRLVTSIKIANCRILETARYNNKFLGRGSTVVAAYFSENQAYIAHAGICRAYKFHDKSLIQLTKDHSLLNDYLKERNLTQEEIENFFGKGVMTQAVGMKSTIKVDCTKSELKSGDIYLLCSIGLHMRLKLNEIEAILNKEPDLERACDLLIQAADKSDVRSLHHTTLILIRCEDD